jgi:hypothetical protein
VNELLHRVRPSGGSHRPPSATLNERPPMRHRSHLHRARWGMATIRRGASRSLAERLPRNAQLAHPVHQGRPRHAQAGEPASRPPASWLCRPGVRRGGGPTLVHHNGREARRCWRGLCGYTPLSQFCHMPRPHPWTQCADTPLLCFAFLASFREHTRPIRLCWIASTFQFLPDEFVKYLSTHAFLTSW